MRSRRMFLNIITTMIEFIITIIAGFVVPNYIIRAFGSSANGLVSSITQFLGYISLIESGIGAIGRASLYKPLAEKDIDGLSSSVKALETFYHKISYIFVIYMALLLLFFPLLANQEFSWAYIALLIIILSFSTFIQYFFGITSQTVLQADQKKYIPSILQAFTLVINTLITVVLINLGFNVHAVKCCSALAFAIRPIYLYFYVKKHYCFKSDVTPNSRILKQRWDGFAQHIAFFVHKNTDIVILTVFSSLSDVSVYSVYMLVVSGCSKLINIITGNFEPIFGNMVAKGEKDILESRLNLCSLVTMQFTLVVFSMAAMILSSFIHLYTRGITDAIYIRPFFAIIMLIAEAVYCYRLPYQSVVYAYGHFRQTRNGSILEAVLNLSLSVIFVFNWGLTGVALGTMISMVYRTCQYCWYYHVKLIKNRLGILTEFKKLFVLFVEILILICVNHIISFIPQPETYVELLFFAFGVGVICSIVVLAVSFVCFKKEMIEITSIIKRIVFHKHKIV